MTTQWLAIHLPELSLEVYTRAQATAASTAVCRGERILICNRVAAALGVRPGQTLADALALSAELRVVPQDEGAERDALERLAVWCGRFTPQVSLEPPRAILMEIARSLSLFGGAQALFRQVASGVAALGYHARYCVAPTPGGALLLARAGVCAILADHAAMRPHLADLPVAALGLTERQHVDLGRMGLRRIADLLRLPRSGLAERFGTDFIAKLERLLGEVPDPRPWFEPPAHYRGHLELPAESTRAEALVFACRRLLDELAGMLASRQSGVQRVVWSLHHAGNEATRIVLGSAGPEADAERWVDLLRERFERVQLRAPVRAITLEARDLLARMQEAAELFPEPGAREPDPHLFDRLRARLGEDAVRGLALVADHRPERAWRWCAPGTHPGTARGRSDRPYWLMPKPMPLATRDGRPWFAGGPLDLGVERERIETGWWDGGAVARDYFIATAPNGECLWVYRELNAPYDWYLHGLFG